MVEREHQSPKKREDNSGVESESPPGVTSPLRRLSLGKLLQHVFGEDGVAYLKQRNWTGTGFFLVTLGVVSDLLSIFDELDVPRWGLFASGIAAVMFGVIVVFRLKGRTLCIAPFVSSLLLGAMFTLILLTQNLANAEDEGVIAKMFPELAVILEGIYDRLTSIEAKVDKIVQVMERRYPDADPTTLAAARSAVEKLAASGEARKKKAFAELEDGEEERAITDLMRLAEDQTEAAQDQTEQAAQTWKDVGAIAFQVDTEKALRAYRKAVELSPKDPAASHQLGLLLMRKGDWDGATALYKGILNGSGATDLSWKAIALNNLGSLERKRGNLDAAVEYFQRSLALAEELGHNKRGIAMSLANIETSLNELGAIEWNRGNLDAAVAYFRRHLALAEELGHKERSTIPLYNLGLLERGRGNLDAAMGYYRRSLALAEERGDKQLIADSLSNLGSIEGERGNLDAAVGYYRRSLALYEELGWGEYAIAMLLNALGSIEGERGNLDAAVDYYRRSLALAEERGDKRGIADSLGNLGLIEYNRGNLDAACSQWKKSAEILGGYPSSQQVEVQNWIDDKCIEGP